MATEQGVHISKVAESGELPDLGPSPELQNYPDVGQAQNHSET